MKASNNKKKWIGAAIVVAAILLIAYVGIGSTYMLHYTLDNPMSERRTRAQSLERLQTQQPWMQPWLDSLYNNKAVHDTFVVMPSGERHHALFIRSSRKTNLTAVIVHGYKMRAEGMLHIAYIYNCMGWNTLLPDLHAHGESEGKAIGMGWQERKDVLRWSAIADSLFADSTGHTHMLLHGISMGAATVMAVSGEHTPNYIKGFVEDCGYSSVWEELAYQLHEQFNLPEFPLMQATSRLCEAKYGWSFSEARQIDQVKKCSKPMLFIHGDKDDFVPTQMVYPLYEAKRGKKQLYISPGSKHAASYRDHPEAYATAVKKFAASVIPH